MGLFNRKKSQDELEDGDEYFNNYQYEKAIECYDKVLETTPKNIKTWENKGVALQSIGRSEEAIECYDKVLEIEPENIKIWNNKGVILHNLRRYEEAIECYDKVIEKDPVNIEAWENKERAFYRMGEFGKEIQCLSKILTINPLDKNAWSNKGIALHGLGKYEEAINCYDEAIRIDPADQKVYYNKEKAMKDLMSEVRRVVIEVNLSLQKFEQGNWKEAALIIKNTSDFEVQIIKLEFSEVVQVDRIETYNLRPREEKEVRFLMKFIDSGNVPLKITVKSNINYNNEYSFEHALERDFVINVNKEAEGQIEGSSCESESTLTQNFPTELANNYINTSLLGEGGFARVYKAVREGKTYALKIPITMNESTGKTFINEIQNWTQFEHPNIVKVHDYNILPVPYFEMDFCEKSLEDYQKPVPADEASWIIFNICEGLRYAHSKGVIHCDIKPQNILFGTDGTVKITDWGLSKALGSKHSEKSSSFSPFYAAPEQFVNQSESAATDVWQTGVIFYELLTGKLPFDGKSASEILKNIAQANPEPFSSLNPEGRPFENIISKCLKKDPEERYQSVYDLQVDLSRAMNDQYKHLLKHSAITGDMQKSSIYCGELVLANLRTGELSAAYLYAMDLVNYTKGDVKEMSEKFAEKLEFLINEDLDEVSDELLDMSEMIVHKVRMG